MKINKLTIWLMNGLNKNRCKIYNICYPISIYVFKGPSSGKIISFKKI